MRLYIKRHIYKIVINILILLIPMYYVISTILHNSDKYLPLPNPITKLYAITVIINFGAMTIYYLVDLVLSNKKMSIVRWLLIIYYLGMLVNGFATFMICKLSGL